MINHIKRLDISIVVLNTIVYLSQKYDIIIGNIGILIALAYINEATCPLVRLFSFIFSSKGYHIYTGPDDKIPANIDIISLKK